MTAQALLDTAGELFADHRGILAMDESIATCNRRFATAGIDQDAESRRAYRELLINTPGLAQSINGAILSPRNQGRRGYRAAGRASPRANY